MVLFQPHTMGQIDENIARLLEQEENLFRASSSHASTRNTRSSNTVSHEYFPVLVFFYQVLPIFCFQM